MGKLPKTIKNFIKKRLKLYTLNKKIFLISLIIVIVSSLILSFLINVIIINNFIKLTKSYVDNIMDSITYNIENENINNFLISQKIGKNGIIGIIYNDNRIITNKSIQDKNFIKIIDKLNKNEKTPKVYSAYIVNQRTINFKKIFIIYSPYEILKEKNINLLPNILISCITGISITFIGIFILNNIFIMLPIKNLQKKTNLIRNGDLTVQFNTKKKDELGEISNNINYTMFSLKDITKKVYISVIITTKILRKLFKSSTYVSSSANAQASTIEQTQENFENLNSMIKTITEESTRGTKYTSQAFEKSKIGMESIKKLESEMSRIESSSKEITDIIRIINDIAEQTELLSLNASIESARSGEAGKGFNVVAGEVRKLAEKTTYAANKVYDLITNNTNLIREGVSHSKNASKVLKEIAETNEISASIVRTISEEIQKIKISSNEILGVINYIAEVAQANLIESSRVSDTTAELGIQALELQKSIQKFDVRDEEIKTNQAHIEKLLKSKLKQVNFIFNEYGKSFLPTGNKIKIQTEQALYIVDELQLGNLVITNNFNFIDMISKKTNTFITIFQRADDKLVAVSTTIRYYDETRAIGEIIEKNTEIYKTVIKGATYYGRLFVINRWYIVVFKPLIDKTGFVLGVISMGLPEELHTSVKIKTASQATDYKDGIIEDKTFKHNY